MSAQIVVEVDLRDTWRTVSRTARRERHFRYGGDGPHRALLSVPHDLGRRELLGRNAVVSIHDTAWGVMVTVIGLAEDGQAQQGLGQVARLSAEIQRTNEARRGRNSAPAEGWPPARGDGTV